MMVMSSFIVLAKLKYIFWVRIKGGVQNKSNEQLGTWIFRQNHELLLNWMDFTSKKRIVDLE